jgi:hypothetical protein
MPPCRIRECSKIRRWADDVNQTGLLPLMNGIDKSTQYLTAHFEIPCEDFSLPCGSQSVMDQLTSLQSRQTSIRLPEKVLNSVSGSTPISIDDLPCISNAPVLDTTNPVIPVPDVIPEAEEIPEGLTHVCSCATLSREHPPS